MSLHDPIPPGQGEPAGPDESPPRCPECATILSNPYPASRRDGGLEGTCPEHGAVPATYGTRDEILARRAS